jgi:hypothetical protein
MAKYLFDIVPNEVWLEEDNGAQHFYMNLPDYENALKPIVDETQEKLNALGEAITFLLQEAMTNEPII